MPDQSWRLKGASGMVGLLLGVLTQTLIQLSTFGSKTETHQVTSPTDATHTRSMDTHVVSEVSLEDSAIAELPEEEALVMADVARAQTTPQPSPSHRWHLQPFNSGEHFLEQISRSGALSGAEDGELFRRFQVAVFQLPKEQLIELMTLSNQLDDQRLFNNRFLLADALNEKLSFDEAVAVSQTLLSQNDTITPGAISVKSGAPEEGAYQGQALLETAFQKQVMNDTYAALDWFAQTLLLSEDSGLRAAHERRLSQVILTQLQALDDQSSIDWVLSQAKEKDRRVMMDILGE